MTQLKSIIASSWSNLQDLLFEDSFVPEFRRTHSRYLFRGMADANWLLLTSLNRLSSFRGPENLPVNVEEEIIQNFKRYAHREVVERDTVWHWLTVGQHHGLPTRLLDWTYSPFVALHFATADIWLHDKDGVIFMVDAKGCHELLPQVLRVPLGVASVYDIDTLASSLSSLEYFDSLTNPGASPYLLFFEPPSLDDRIVSQFALFSMASDPAAHLQDWVDYHPKLFKRIIIPAELKPEIRAKLDIMNVTERILFPGLDGTAEWIRRQFAF